jgi:hypothetical protein
MLAGCRQVEEATPEVHQPATLEEVAGLETLRVSFDQEAADRVSLRTAEVRGAARGSVVPYDALIYDAQGVAWVYVSPKPLVFQRARVAVDHVTGGTVWLRSGPPPGTRVVTVGSTQVYGAELDIAGGH